MLPLLLLLVSGCLGASLENNGVSTDSYVNTNKEVVEGPPDHVPDIASGLNKLAYKVDETSASSPITINSNPGPAPPVAPTVSVEAPLKKEVVANVVTVANLIDVAGLKATTPQQEYSGAHSVTDQQQVVSSGGSNAMVQETSAAPAPAKPYSESTPSATPSASVITSKETSTTMKTVPTQGVASANITISTTMNPAPTQTSGTSAKMSTATTSCSTATTMKPISTTQGTTTRGSTSTTAGLKTTAGATVATTTAPKKNDGSSTTISLLLSVVPIVVSVVLNRS